MVDEPDSLTSRGGSGGTSTVKMPFVLIGEVTFGPRFFPDRIQVTKERELDRTSNFCKGEDVADKGAKNREIHVNGRLIGQERRALDRVADSPEVFTMSSTTWSGEVRVSTVEYEGPQGYHPPSDSLIWEYTLDLVSTGRDERDSGSGGNGILDDGETDLEEAAERGAL